LHNFYKCPLFPIRKTTYVSIIVTWIFNISIMCGQKYYECVQYKMEGANLFDDDLWSVVPFNKMTTIDEHTCEHTTNHIFTTTQVFQSFMNFWKLVRLVLHKLQCFHVSLNYCLVFFSNLGLITKLISPLFILVM